MENLLLMSCFVDSDIDHRACEYLCVQRTNARVEQQRRHKRTRCAIEQNGDKNHSLLCVNEILYEFNVGIDHFDERVPAPNSQPFVSVLSRNHYSSDSVLSLSFTSSSRLISLLEINYV